MEDPAVETERITSHLEIISPPIPSLPKYPSNIQTGVTLAVNVNEDPRN
jgi:hypothetical protein